MIPPAVLCDLRAPAHAKVNLVLGVGPRRVDGYHDLETLMVPVALADVLRVRVTKGEGPVTCRVPARPELDGPGNLAARAAESFRRTAGVNDGIEIEIEKRIPVTAGLGGGSSDAAAVFRALARAYRLPLERFAADALEVGSDVPFFLGRGAAWARGRGELLADARVPTLHLVLAYPKDPALAIRAADAYRWLDEARRTSPPGAAVQVRGDGAWRPEAARNDLQAPCLQRFPTLGRLLGRIAGLGASSAMMSGSGPSLFGIFSGHAAACRAGLVLEDDPSIEVHVVRTLQRLPGVSRWKSPRSASSRSARRS